MIRLFIDAGVIALAAFISPLEEDRQRIKEIIGPVDVIEVFCNCPLEICEKRDVKGMYKKARAGEIKNYTGISAPYEPPKEPDIEVLTGYQSLEECVEIITRELFRRGIIFRHGY